MNTETIIRLLENSGFQNLRADATHIYMEDPSCILRSFETFAGYAWVAITVFAGLMLTGWAISMIRGAKNDVFNNLKNLFLVFGGLSAVGAIVNVIYGDDIFARGCKTISAPISELNELLQDRNKRFGNGENELYERLDIYDTGPIYDVNSADYDIEYEDENIDDEYIYDSDILDDADDTTLTPQQILENLDGYYDYDPTTE